MHFYNTNEDYVQEASHFQPIYSLSAETVPPRQMKFTGFKSPRCVNDFEVIGIPFDGSHWMFRIDEDWDGHSIFVELLEIWIAEAVWFDVGLDPRARNSTTWRIVGADLMGRILNTAHIYGATKYITISQIVTVSREEAVNE